MSNHQTSIITIITASYIPVCKRLYCHSPGKK